MTAPVGILGGTFDPIHFGHLRTALELLEELALERLLLVPVGRPPHRNRPLAPAADRLAMIELAVAGEPRLIADDRELERPGPSYTVDTLRELRAQLGAERPLVLCIGADSWLTIEHWSRYRELIELAHIAVLARPGFDHDGQAMPAPFAARSVASAQMLQQAPAGSVYTTRLTPIAISATRIRELVASGRSPRYLLPDVVWEHIREHNLYRHTR